MIRLRRLYLCVDCCQDMVGAEIYVNTINQNYRFGQGYRSRLALRRLPASEKLHEQMIAWKTLHILTNTTVISRYCQQSTIGIRTQADGHGKKVPQHFVYDSDNTEWMTISELQAWMKVNEAKIDRRQNDTVRTPSTIKTILMRC